MHVWWCEVHSHSVLLLDLHVCVHRFKEQFPRDNEAHSGQPACTPCEIERFDKMLADARLTDAFRALAPNGIYQAGPEFILHTCDQPR